MAGDSGAKVDPDRHTTYLEEAAFPTSLSLIEVVAKFWGEIKKIAPASELHVIDPYLLDAGGQDPATYARNVTALLKPALAVTKRVVLVYNKPREGIRELLERDFELVNKDAGLDFKKGSQMHGRYIIGDRCRALRLEFSFNRIGKTFGTVSFVQDPEDVTGILHELERLHPNSAS